MEIRITFLDGLKQRIILWLIKKLLGRKTIKSPVSVIWEMIDEENSKGSGTGEDWEPEPNCIKIEAWEEAADRISRECFGEEPKK